MAAGLRLVPKVARGETRISAGEFEVLESVCREAKRAHRMMEDCIAVMNEIAGAGLPQSVREADDFSRAVACTSYDLAWFVRKTGLVVASDSEEQPGTAQSSQIQPLVVSELVTMAGTL